MKITNILHRTFKAGKIIRADKGINVGVRQERISTEKKFLEKTV